MATRRGRAHIRGEHFTHRYLWYTAEMLRDSAVQGEIVDGRMTMAAALFTFLAIEAFANDLGPRVAPPAWEDERAFFARGRYQGTLGKLRYIGTALGVPIDTSRRPYQTLRELRKRRDDLVHARTEIVDQVVYYRTPAELGTIAPAIHRFGDDRFLHRAMADAEELCDRLQAAAQADLGQGTIVSPRAFRGMLMHQSGSILDQPEALGGV